MTSLHFEMLRCGCEASVRDLVAQSGLTPYAEEAYRSRITKAEAPTIGAYLAGVLVGIAIGSHVYDTITLEQIAVHPTHVGSGIGTSLLHAFIQASAGASIELEVSAVNERALRLYEKTGFLEVGRRPRYYDGATDAVLYTRPEGPVRTSTTE